MFQMLGVFAEFERGIIRERVNAGLARARAKGTKLGRRRVKPSVEAQIWTLLPSKGRIQMSKTNYLQTVLSDLQRTAGPYRCANKRLGCRSKASFDQLVGGSKKCR